jgi:hypothetical protein
MNILDIRSTIILYTWEYFCSGVSLRTFNYGGYMRYGDAHIWKSLKTQYYKNIHKCT